VIRVAELGAELLRGAVAVAIGTGLLYLLEPPTRGLAPSVPDALPLDELPHRASVSLWPFVAVWTAVAATVRPLAPRRSHAWTRALAFWLPAFAGVAVSIAVVRQVSVPEAVLAALTTPAPYAAAVVFALATARRPRARTSHAGA
jgi:hypothetical protein